MVSLGFQDRLAVMNGATKPRTQGRPGQSKYLNVVLTAPRPGTVEEFMALLEMDTGSMPNRGAVYRSLWALAKRGLIEHRNGFFGTAQHFAEAE